MFKRLPNLTYHFSRLRKPPVPADTLAAAKSRGWKQMQVLLAQQSMNQSSTSKTYFSPILAYSFVLVVLTSAYVLSPVSPLRVRSVTQTSPLAQGTPASDNAFLNQVSGRPQTFGVNTKLATIGYVKKPVAISNSNIAYAAESTLVNPAAYKAELFYTKSLDKIPQIFEYDIASKQVIQVTHSAVGATSPIFSSANQLLAYSDYVSPEAGNTGLSSTHCASYISDPKSNQVITTFEKSGDCYAVISWSPDGTKLLLGHELNIASAVARGDTPVYNLEVFSIKDKSILVIPGPKTFLGQEGGNWLTSDTFFVRYGDDFDLNSVQAVHTLAEVNAVTGKITTLKSDFIGSRYQVLGNKAFFFRDNGTVEVPNKHVMEEPFDQSRSASSIGGTENADEILGFSNSAGTVTNILTGRSASTNNSGDYSYPQGQVDASSQVNTTDLTSRTTENLFTQNGSYFEQFVGWYNDYHHVIYTTRNENGQIVTVHLLDTSTNSDQVLFTQ